MFTIKGKTITLTRGDTLKAVVNMVRPNPMLPSDKWERIYPGASDVITFRASASWDAESSVIEKTVPHDTMTLTLDPEDTEDLDYGQYVFDVAITYANGDVDTFIKEGTLILTKRTPAAAEEGGEE